MWRVWTVEIKLISSSSSSSDKDGPDIGSHGYQIHLLAKNYKLDIGTGTAWKQWKGRLNNNNNNNNNNSDNNNNRSLFV